MLKKSRQEQKNEKYRLSPLVHTAWNNIFLPYH